MTESIRMPSGTLGVIRVGGVLVILLPSFVDSNICQERTRYFSPLVSAGTGELLEVSHCMSNGYVRLILGQMLRDGRRWILHLSPHS